MTTPHFPEVPPACLHAGCHPGRCTYDRRPVVGAAGHSSLCDYVQYPDDPDKECYCPTPEEAAEQRRYEAAIAEGEPPEPYWVTPS